MLVTSIISNHIHFSFHLSTEGISLSPYPAWFLCLVILWLSGSCQMNISFTDGWWRVYKWNYRLGKVKGRLAQRRTTFIIDFIYGWSCLAWEWPPCFKKCERLYLMYPLRIALNSVLSPSSPVSVRLPACQLGLSAIVGQERVWRNNATTQMAQSWG